MAEKLLARAVRASRIRRTLQRLGLVFTGTVVGLLMAEVMLRQIAPAARLPYQVNAHREDETGKFCKHDALLGWVGRPDVSGQFTSVDCAHFVRQNRYGCRGTTYSFPRSKDNRLLVLGDSFAWGYGVEEAEMYTTLLERRANPPLEVVNLGVSGYGTDQELLHYLQLGRKFQADQILLVATPYTDLEDNLRSEQFGCEKPLFNLSDDGQLELTNVPVPLRPSQWVRIAKDQKVISNVSILCRIAARSSVVATAINGLAESPAARSWLESRLIIPPRQGGYDWELWSHLSPAQPKVEHALRVYFRLISELNREVKQDGARLSILLVPSAIDVDDELWESFKSHNDCPSETTWDRNLIQRRIIEFCNTNEIDLIDPTDSFKKAAQRNRYLYYPWNRHWTPIGHKIVARLLLKQFSDGNRHCRQKGDR